MKYAVRNQSGVMIALVDDPDVADAMATEHNGYWQAHEAPRRAQKPTPTVVDGYRVITPEGKVLGKFSTEAEAETACQLSPEKANVFFAEKWPDAHSPPPEPVSFEELFSQRPAGREKEPDEQPDEADSGVSEKTLRNRKGKARREGWNAPG